MLSRGYNELGSELATCCESFLHYIAGFLFVLSYGLSHVVTSRWSSNRPSSRVDFGQIIPLILIILSFLVAIGVSHDT